MKSKIKKFNEYIDNEVYVKIDVKQHIDIVERKMGNCSDRVVIADHPSYKKIIENGTDSLPYLFEMVYDGNCIFWRIALESITNIKSPKLDSQGITDFWINWGKEHGY